MFYYDRKKIKYNEFASKIIKSFCFKKLRVLPKKKKKLKILVNVYKN